MQLEGNAFIVSLRFLAYLPAIFSLSIVLLCTSCQSDDEVPFVATDNPPDVSVEPIIPTGDENYLNKDSDYLFDQEVLHTFELTIPEVLLNRINNDPAAEEYVEGSLTFEGETVSPVGVRYKGSIGAFVGCLTSPNWWEPSGSKTCTKLSMKIKINWLDTDQKFFGLKKLQLHSMNNDPSQMRERLGYWLFREMGVPAPRAVHARLLINGNYVGLFALIEQIDGRFTRYNFSDGSGNLYKEVWPLTQENKATNTSTLLNALKTNEDESPSVDMMANFAAKIEMATNEEIPEVISANMNLDEIMAYCAVDRSIRHDDGPFHWYCNNGDCSNHNYYWYENPDSETLHLIPWDLDHAFVNIITPNNAVTFIVDDWGATSANCMPFNGQLFVPAQRSATCDKLTAGWVSFESLYQQKKEQFKNGPLALENANKQLELWEEQIRAATQEANQNHGDAISINQWEGALNGLKNQLEHARNN